MDFRPIISSQLKGGVLKDGYDAVYSNLFLKVDEQGYSEVFNTTHGSWYAEPEFAGKYLDTASKLFESSKNQDIYEKGKKVVDIILASQREDGYLGTYKKGLEFDHTFSVWNATYVMMGLISWYEVTADEEVLKAIIKSMDFIAKSYLAIDGPPLLYGINESINNSCVLLQAARLYRITGKILYKDFCDFIIEQWESTTLRLVTFPHALWIGCTKAAEMLICYQGLVEYGSIIGENQYIDAADKYWEEIKNQHIRITGNGSLAETWTKHRNTPMQLTNDLRPNENCVGVTWMKLCAALFAKTGKAKFMHAFEKTMFNHLLGSKAVDGSDFSYYQGTIGRKLHETFEGQYKCCCYRGMNIFSYIPRYIYWKSENTIAVTQYSASSMQTDICDSKVTLEQATNFPKSGNADITLDFEKDCSMKLMLRVPDWSAGHSISLNGELLDCESEDGFIAIERIWQAGKTDIQLDFEMKTVIKSAIIEGQECAAVTHGPLVLALDTRYDTPIYNTKIDIEDGEIHLEKIAVSDDCYAPMVRYQCDGEINSIPQKITLVDYASAGSIDHEKDNFRIWIPTAGKDKKESADWKDAMEV
jgi:DUF1680 family protein